MQAFDALAGGNIVVATINISALPPSPLHLRRSAQHSRCLVQCNCAGDAHAEPPSAAKAGRRAPKTSAA